MFRITVDNLRKFVKRGEKIRVTPCGRISNGKWAYLRSAGNQQTLNEKLEDRGCFTAQLSDEDLNDCLPDMIDYELFTKTLFLVDIKGTIARMFKSGEKQVFLDERYVRTFKVEELYCSKNDTSLACYNAARKENATLVIMPMRYEEEDYDEESIMRFINGEE